MLVDDEGAVGEGVGADGCDGDYTGAGVHEGAACGEVVGGGTAGSGKDKAVRAVVIDFFFGRGECESAEVRFLGLDNDVVEGVVVGAVGKGKGEEGAWAGVVLALKDLRELVEDGIRVVCGEKAELAEVHAYDGGLGGCAGGHDAEECAISADG